MSNPIRYGPRYSNTGLGNKPSKKEIDGLLGPYRGRRNRYANQYRELKEKALAGDKHAIECLKKWHLASAKSITKRKEPTKVHLSFMDRDVGGNENEHEGE
jgi:hypothetical protein